jgi:hypothetical protein
MIDHRSALHAPDIAGHRLFEFCKHFSNFLVGRVHHQSYLSKARKISFTL